ncbi:MAG: ACT domain-containing protein [Desulfovibrio sp.]|nr:ACT domain-containing protein [Desulfovibrio sp.]
MTIDQLSVFVENKPGHLLEITETLGGAGIDLRALSIGDTAEFGVLRLIVSEADRALAVLREAGFAVSLTQVLAVSLADTPGSLSKILRVIAGAGINVEYLYAFVTRKSGSAYVVFRVEDNAAATAILDKNGIVPVGPEDLL